LIVAKVLVPEKTTEEILEPPKAPSPREVTFGGIVIESRFEPSNALSPMVATVTGIK
jgi:hypothetical protein